MEMDNTVANISTFEGLQANANTAMGCSQPQSQMAFFNATPEQEHKLKQIMTTRMPHIAKKFKDSKALSQKALADKIAATKESLECQAKLSLLEDAAKKNGDKDFAITVATAANEFGKMFADGHKS
jgi:hypothetical protein